MSGHYETCGVCHVAICEHTLPQFAPIAQSSPLEAPRPQTSAPSPVDLALSWVGIVANPTAADDGWTRYLDVIAQGEAPSRHRDMAAMSGCALVVRGWWPRILARPPAYLLAPYRIGNALVDVARAGCRCRIDPNALAPGDVVHLGAGGGGVEHVYIATAVDHSNPYGHEVKSVDGGQRVGQWEAIRARERGVEQDGGRWWDVEVDGPTRPVVAVYSLAMMLARYGAA